VRGKLGDRAQAIVHAQAALVASYQIEFLEAKRTWKLPAEWRGKEQCVYIQANPVRPYRDGGGVAGGATAANRADAG
jgi:hypothetical protein